MGDRDGIVPAALCAACEKVRDSGKRAKALYTIPTGQNPTGARLSADRAREIYKIARQYDLLIIEDDAYYFLQHNALLATNGGGSDCSGNDMPASAGFGETLIGMDTDGRVVRLDSFSKCMAAGFRLGWITAPKDLVRAYDSLAYFSSQHGSSLSMVVLGSILQTWGWDGFMVHVATLQRKLRGNALRLLKAADQYLKGVATWHAPSSGMFLWVQLAQDISPQEFLQRMQAHAVLGVHGDCCAVQRQADRRGATFLRLSYVLEDEDAIEEGVRRLGELLRAAAPAL